MDDWVAAVRWSFRYGEVGLMRVKVEKKQQMNEKWDEVCERMTLWGST